jgi:hypothetical protein
MWSSRKANSAFLVKLNFNINKRNTSSIPILSSHPKTLMLGNCQVLRMCNTRKDVAVKYTKLGCSLQICSIIKNLLKYIYVPIACARVG